MSPVDLENAVQNLEELLSLLKEREQREFEKEKQLEEQKEIEKQLQDAEKKEQLKQLEVEKKQEEETKKLQAEEKKLEAEEKKKVEKEKEAFNDLMKNIDENIAKLSDANTQNNLDMLDANAELLEQIKVLSDQEPVPQKPTTAEHVINIYGLIIIPGILIIVLLWKMIKPFT